MTFLHYHSTFQKKYPLLDELVLEMPINSWIPVTVLSIREAMATALGILLAGTASRIPNA